MLNQNEADERLLEAADRGVLEDVAKLVDLGADVNTRDEEGCTPLLLAVGAGKVGMAKYLVEHGADPAKTSTDKDSLLHLAASSECLECVEFALGINSALDLNNSEGLTPLYYAIECKDQDIFEFLISKGADADTVDVNRWTTLHHAAALGLSWFVNRLIELGVDREAVSLKGNTALQLAQSIAPNPVVEAILKSK